jgi:beta-phosphoglucomutase-like phosphatase (HAD superfamily)
VLLGNPVEVHPSSAGTILLLPLPVVPTCAGAVELVRACRAAGLKTAVGSSAEQVKVRTAAAHRRPARSAIPLQLLMSGDSLLRRRPAPM